MSERVPLVTRIAGSPHRGRFASLEGYRGLAATSVVWYHARGNFHPIRSGSADLVDNLGNVGVAVFFLLSGFLLYFPVSQAMFAQTDGPPPAQFLLRRFVRIYPAYWVALIGWALVIDDKARAGLKPWKLFLLFDGGLHGLPVAWSLVVELWFYISIAVLAVVLPRLARRCRDRRGILQLQLVMLASMVVVAYGYRWWVSVDIHRWLTYANWIFAFLDWFAIGMAMAVAVAWTDAGGRLPPALKGLADRELWCFAIAFFAYVTGVLVLSKHPNGFQPETRVSYLYRNGIHGVVAGFLLLPATLGDRAQRVQRLLRRPYLAALGTVSYGVYLWHHIVIDYLRQHRLPGTGYVLVTFVFVVTMAVTLVIATLSYRLVERPALRLVRTPGRGVSDVRPTTRPMSGSAAR